MNVAELKEEYEHPALVTAAGTFIAYGLVLVAMTVLLFGVPLAIFSLL
ncbi:MAG: hypothetical protein ACI8UR_001218 [Natronomonas sp.]|jgi:hypothetical protein